MANYIAPLQRLIEQFRHLPGIGSKTAVRLAFSVLDFSDDEAREFADAILGAKSEIHLCPECFNISVGGLCPICSDMERDHEMICVVEDARAVMAFERVREYRGLYHVLGGTLSPMNGVGPEELRIKELIERLKSGKIHEVIVATNATVEGEATAMYIAKLLSPLGVSVSRLAYGIPVGGDLEYADEVTLNRALEGRRNIN